VLLVAANVVWAAWALLGAHGKEAGFHVRDVQGSVAYVDGSAVPVEMMLIKMFPESGRGAISTTSMPVTARVDPSTGRFRAKWAGSKKERKSPAEMWRVVVLSGDQKPLANDIVPREYGIAEETPLIVAMDGSPLLI
jgi:hypothetical protein